MNSFVLSFKKFFLKFSFYLFNPSSLFIDINFEKYAEGKKKGSSEKCLENTANSICPLESHYEY